MTGCRSFLTCCKSFLVRLTVLEATHTEKRCEEPSNLGNITLLWVVSWNTFRFQWKWFRVSECLNLLRCMFEVLCFKCWNSAQERVQTIFCSVDEREVPAISSPHIAFMLSATSSWKVRKCTSPHVVIQKNPTSNSLLHCLKFSSRDTTWSPKKMPLCRPTGILCCQQSSSPKASWLLGINHKSHSKEKSKSPCGKPLNSLRRWISKKFWKVVSSWRHHRVSHSSF